MMPGPEQMSAMLEAQQVLGRAVSDLRVSERRILLDWSAVMCSCSFLRFSPGRPVFAECPVHSEYVILPDGSIL